MRLRSSCLSVLAAIIPPLSAAAQVDVSAWPQVRMELLATDGNGDVLRGLTADDLTLTENKKPVKVDELKPLSEPMSVCLLIDSSGSMYNKRQSVDATAKRLIADLPPEDEYCVVDFSSQAFIDQNLTTDHKLAAKALSYIKASGGTALYDALSSLGDYMRKTARNPSRAILVLSDGADNASKMNLDTLRRDWQQPGTPSVHVLWIPSPKGSDDHGDDRHEQKEVLKVANIGGGLVFFPRDEAELTASSDNLIDALKNRYLLTYTSEDTSKDGRQRQLDVGLDKAHQKAKDVVRAPEGYYAPR
jgi:Ca-activated chloride channel family protein